MERSMNGARCLAGACAVLLAAGCVLAAPASAFAGQSSAGDTAVYVTFGQTGQGEPAGVLTGNVEQVVDVAPASGQAGGALPETGDRVCALACALVGLAAASLQVRCALTWGRREDDGR